MATHLNNIIKQHISTAKILVIKIGSSLLIDETKQNIGLNNAWLAGLAKDIKRAQQRGQNVVIVSSGAVALGLASLGLTRKSLTLEQSQAAAAAGQIALAHGWQTALAPLGLAAAQILLTIEDTEQRRRYLNARQTITELLNLGAVPIINENDTIATQELRYGDNDRLAARVAGMISAECLVLLSDVDGFYSAPPNGDTASEFIGEIDKIDDSLMAMAQSSGSAYGSGGMVTKLEAAKIVMRAGCHMVLADGRGVEPLAALMQGARASLFRASQTPRRARKQWIGGTLQIAGCLHIDAGAVDALGDGKSLLPIGVVAVEGQFERGDCVKIIAPDGGEIARGLAAYAHGDAAQICGQPSAQIVGLLGYKGRAEMVHRDNLIITKGNG